MTKFVTGDIVNLICNEQFVYCQILNFADEDTVFVQNIMTNETFAVYKKVCHEVIDQTWPFSLECTRAWEKYLKCADYANKFVLFNLSKEFRSARLKYREKVNGKAYA